MKRLTIILPLFLILVGCTARQIQQTAIQQVTPTPVLDTTKPPLNQEELITPTKSVRPTWTLPARLPEQDAFSKVDELLQTNGNCRLPCWWGIIPGQTNWEYARSVLFPLAKSVYDDYSTVGEFSPGLLTYYLSDYSRFFEQDYIVIDGIVQEIKIKLPNLSPFYTPRGILEDYGMPDEVYVGGNAYEPNVENEQYFSIALYYEKQRVFAYYGGGFQPIQYGPMLGLCFGDIDYAELHVWGPTYPFDKTRDNVFEENGNRFYLISDVTELTIDDFFVKFTGSSESPCFASPAQKWLP